MRLVEYGSYPQELVTDESIITELDSKSKKESNEMKIELNGVKYAKVYPDLDPFSYGLKTFTNGEKIIQGKAYYFKYSPIKWIELEDTKLLSLYLLSSDLFDDNDFMPTTKFNKSSIKKKTIKNFIKHSFIDEGNSIYLPSLEILNSSEYGFEYGRGPQEQRKAKLTDYALALGAYKEDESNCGIYWTMNERSANELEIWVVDPDGDINSAVNTDSGICIRPILEKYV